MSAWLTPGVDEALCFGAVFIAACVRGYAGLGFSAISIGLMSLWRSPSELVPLIFILEVPASLLLLREALKDYSRTWLTPLLGGSAVGIPMGVALLAHLPGVHLQWVVGLCIVACSQAVLRGWHPPGGDTQRLRWLTGWVSGVLNGLSALGGVSSAVMLAAVQTSPQTLRATLTLLFLFTDALGLVLAWWGRAGATAHAEHRSPVVLALGRWYFLWLTIFSTR